VAQAIATKPEGLVTASGEDEENSIAASSAESKAVRIPERRGTNHDDAEDVDEGDDDDDGDALITTTTSTDNSTPNNDASSNSFQRAFLCEMCATAISWIWLAAGTALFIFSGLSFGGTAGSGIGGGLVAAATAAAGGSSRLSLLLAPATWSLVKMLSVCLITTWSVLILGAGVMVVGSVISLLLPMLQ